MYKQWISGTFKYVPMSPYTVWPVLEMEENRRKTEDPKNPMKLVEDFQHAEKARPKTVLW